MLISLLTRRVFWFDVDFYFFNRNFHPSFFPISLLMSLVAYFIIMLMALAGKATNMITKIPCVTIILIYIVHPEAEYSSTVRARNGFSPVNRKIIWC